MRKAYDLTGQVFGRLTVISHAGTKGEGKQRSNLWLCKCECGNEKTTLASSLKQGSCKSCGCLHRESSARNIQKVDRTNNGKLLEGDQAAFNIVLRKYKDGAKARNLSFELNNQQFRKLIEDNCYYCGVKPSKTTTNRSKFKPVSIIHNGIDRIDSSIGYEINNCVSACHECNFFKKDAIYDSFLDRITKIFRYMDL